MTPFRKSVIKMGVFTTVTVLLTTVLAMTVANTTSERTHTYTARFTNASGLGEGDDVRINGVKVGKVTSLNLGSGMQAEVHFEVESGRRLARDSDAIVKYRNLAGQRYLALDAVLRGPTPVLAPGGVIPVQRTHPALNLTELFNGFKPLFQALSPKDVNKLSYEIIQVLQGESGNVEGILAHTASLTSTIAKKDEVIGQVIDNLSKVLGTVNARGPQLSELIDSLQKLTTGLAEQRKPVGEAISSLDELSNTTAGLLEDARQPLKKDVAALNGLSKNLEGDLPLMEHDLKTMPNRLGSLTRTVSYGSWFNFYLCQASGTVGISSLDIKVPVIPLPTAEMVPRCQS